ncbi:carbohydrate ABC transporter permease [Breznakia pachnodae]|uniref:N-acetylglucosamine transport system permease protein n=1 Tax=Breznakia pachnodae TaxID=265178 RepID=A0ABU0E0L9_9FIRM|nr:carbohydrate ABC transporter permease [Breznakia pachnodae]MDQ0360319.1 N-acetylglucosamine transport system permease protein [Breznakia pachnodae]
MNKKKKPISIYKIFIYVALITLAITIIVPIIWVFMASLKSQLDLVSNDPFSLPTHLVWQNFVDAFEKARMGDYLINSVLVTSMALIILLAVALPASYVLARFDFFGKKFFNALFMAGLFINVNYIVLPIFVMLFNIEVAFDWTNVLLNNKFVLALIYAATSLPFTIYLLSGFFKTLPKAYEEAARIDGCGYFKTMMRVMIPMARPSIITVILFQFLSFWNEYVLAFTFMDKENSTLAVGVKFLMADARSQSNDGVMYAGLVIIMIPTLILYILVQKKLTQGMSLGGLKD